MVGTLDRTEAALLPLAWPASVTPVLWHFCDTVAWQVLAPTSASFPLPQALAEGLETPPQQEPWQLLAGSAAHQALPSSLPGRGSHQSQALAGASHCCSLGTCSQLPTPHSGLSQGRLLVGRCCGQDLVPRVVLLGGHLEHALRGVCGTSVCFLLLMGVFCFTLYSQHGRASPI